MSGRYQKNFFDIVKPQSEIKLRVYRAYLEPWSAKVGSVSRGRIWVVDGFAGPGRYSSGEPGSPELAMQRAQEISANPKNAFKLQCLFGDARKTATDSLYRLAGRYKEASPMIIEGNFWDRTDDVLALIKDEPALVFVDPFGLVGLDFDKLKRIISRRGRVDLIVNFRSPAAPRLAAKHAAEISRAVGTDEWTLDSLSQTFRTNLEKAGRFLPPASLAIRTRFGGALKSEMILASRNPAAYELWNDQIVREVERLAAEAGEDAPLRDEDIQEVQTRLLTWGSTQLAWHRKDAIGWHVVQFCGEAHTGTIKRACDVLRKNGSWEQTNPGAKVEDAIFRMR